MDVADITQGLKIQHRWHDRSPEFDFIAKVMYVGEDENVLNVQITSKQSGTWTENWNLAHTISGFNMGEYVRVEQ